VANRGGTTQLYRIWRWYYLAMLVDAHAHIDHYTTGLAEALAQISEHHILTLAVSMDVASYAKTIEIARYCKYLIPTFGIHPWEAFRYHDRLDEIEPYLKTTPLVGEAGLDFHWVEDRSRYPSQMAVFEHQCAWARRLSKPMNLHTKGAEREVLEAIVSFNLVNPIIHWYSGPLELIGPYLGAGCYFTLGVEVLSSERIQEIARVVPADRVLLETDNPGGYEWLTKQVGMPAILLDVFAAVPRLKGIGPKDLALQLNQNWEDLTRGVSGITKPQD
jgi:TatD DNase family protein